MRKIVLLMLITLLLQITLSVSLIYDVNVECKNNICVKGEIANWVIDIENRDNEDFELVHIRLVNFTNNKTFLFYPVEEILSENNLDRKEHLIILPNEKKEVIVESWIPSPQNNSIFSFYACFNFSVDSKNTEFIIKKVYGIEKCFKDKFSINIHECSTDGDCFDNSTCKEYACKDLVCDDCQFIKNHKCIDYQCCNNLSCANDQFCLNNSCVMLNCSDSEVPLNHNCNELNCSEQQYYSNHSCINLTCYDNQIAKNHTCNELVCSEDEYLIKNICIKLDCDDNMGFFNHSCVVLNCSNEEVLLNHSCYNPNCQFFQNFINGYCKNDNSIILNLSIELISLGIIIIIVFLFIKMIRAKSSKKKLEK